MTPATDLVTLREYFDALLAAHYAAHDAHEIAHQATHASTQAALEIAAAMAKENKADANEWRSAMDDRERNFATVADLKHLADKLALLDDAEIRRATTEALKDRERMRHEALKDRERMRQQWLIGIAVGVASVMVSITLRLLTT